MSIAGSFTATGMAPPRTLANLRDVASASPILRSGVLLRSDAPHSADASLRLDGAEWPPGTVIDLRDEHEKGEPHPWDGRSRIVALPLLEGRATDIATMPPSLAELYVGMLDGSAAGQLVAAIRTIATGDGAVLVHCTAGKDRTGVVIALALRLVGVDREQVVADYTRTDPAMPGVLARMPVTVRSGAVTTPDPALVDAHALRDLLGAPAEAIGAYLDALDGHRGGAADWYLRAGGDAEVLDALGRRLLV